MKSLLKRTKSMLSLDFRRLWKTPMFYIVLVLALLIPIAMVAMTSMMGEGQITSAWSLLGGSMMNADMENMDMTAMLNINMCLVLVCIFATSFISDDFRSGFSKSLFSVRAKKDDYAISKTIIGTFVGILMILLFFVGTLTISEFLKLSFTLPNGVSSGNIICCLLSKIFLVPVFAGLYTFVSLIFKQRLWANLLGSIAIGILFFMIVGLVTPLTSTIVNVFLCLAGGFIFALLAVIGGSLFLSKLDI